MNYIYYIALAFYCSSAMLSGYPLRSEQEALNHCLNGQNDFVAIVWPIAQGQEALITAIMSRYGKILYRKEYYFTPAKALHILRRAHANTSIFNMEKHVRWYFPAHTYQLPARIFVLEFKDRANTIACKHAIRKIFSSLQYRSIHINDFHYETIELARFFFNA